MLPITFKKLDIIKNHVGRPEVGLFHSMKVRFHDSVPSYEYDKQDPRNLNPWRAYFEGSSICSKLYLHHLHPSKTKSICIT